MTIGKNQVVTVHYSLVDDKGETIATSVDADPLVYLHGYGMMIPGFEKALEGADKGQTVTFSVEPEEAYGHYSEKNIIEVPRSEFPEDEEIHVGWEATATAEDGHTHSFRVIELDDTTVKLDGNHPLAGKTLHFDVDVVDVREATTQEIEHQHVHTDGHDH